MSSEDFYKPTNIRDSIFGILDLPQQSKIQKPSSKAKTYEQNDSDQQCDFSDLQFSRLGVQSKVQPKIKNQQHLPVIIQSSQIQKKSARLNTRPSSSQQKNTSSEQQQQKPSPFAKKPNQQVRRAPVKNRKDSKKGTKKLKQVVDLDAQIGQVRQWGQRNQQNQQQQQEDFDKQQQKKYVPNRQINEELRKKAQEKAKRLQDKSYKAQTKPMGLATKLQQLRKKNSQQKNAQNKQLQKKILQSQTSSDQLNTNFKKLSTGTNFSQQSKKPMIQQKTLEEDEDDPWQKINQKTKQQYQDKTQVNKQPMTKEQVLQFYSKKYIYVEQDIQGQFIFDDLEQQNIPGCWDVLFGCFKNKNQDQEADKKHKHSKDRIAMRLLAISKINVSNTDQEFFILKEIWEKLTDKKFARYGNHWNQIGFQGRDPVTDLRSTGALSLLQWYLFIDQNLSQSKSIFAWTSQNDFPLALTHIKVTGLFIEQLKKGKIKAKNWNDFQKNYNSMAWNVFQKIKKCYKSTDNVGQVVDKTLQSVSKSFSQCLKQYQKRKKN